MTANSEKQRSSAELSLSSIGTTPATAAGVSVCIGNAVAARAKVAARSNEKSSQPDSSIRALNPARRFRSRMSGRILLSFVDFIPVSSEVERVRCALVKSLLVRNWWCGGRNHRPLTRLSFLI
jgi:hypothetical protein